MNPLGMVKNIVEAVGMDIAHVYEDLVFLEHNAFLLQFSESENEMQVHMNSEADKQVIDRDISSLIASARNHGMNFTVGRMYTLSQTDDQSIRLEFSEAEYGIIYDRCENPGCPPRRHGSACRAAGVAFHH